LSVVVGVDVGTSATKALAVDAASGAVLAEATGEYPLYAPESGWAEQDAFDYWERGARPALVALAKKLGARARDVVGIGLSGQMHTAVLLGDKLEVLRRAILWCDVRTSRECRAIEAKVGREGLARMVGNAALEGFTLPKLLWLRSHEPETFARVRHVLMPKDFVAWKLTGELGTDVSDAAGTLAYSTRERAWSVELLDALGVAPEIFPIARGSHEVSGLLRDDVARDLGLPAGIAIAAGAADNAASAVGLGVVRPGTGMISLGTSGVVLVPTAGVVVDPNLILHSFASAVPGASYVMGVMLAAGGALRWYRDTMAPEEKARAKDEGRDSYEVLAELAGRAPIGAGGVVFLPYLMGERTPHADADARGAFVGLTARTTRAHLTRAVFEGITYGIADLAAAAASLGEAAKATTFRAAGGGARSDLFLHLLADVLGATIETTKNTDAAALGAAALGGVAGGAFMSVEAASDALVARAKVVEPDASRHAKHAPVLAAYRGMYPAMREGMHALSAIDRAG
jgi:xylulokinase